MVGFKEKIGLMSKHQCHCNFASLMCLQFRSSNARFILKWDRMIVTNDYQSNELYLSEGHAKLSNDDYNKRPFFWQASSPLFEFETEIRYRLMKSLVLGIIIF